MTRTAHTKIVVLAICAVNCFVSVSVFGSEVDVKRMLLNSGYELSVDGLRSAFSNKDESAINYALNYISRDENRHEFYPLVQDVKHRMAEMDDSKTGRFFYAYCLKALFSIETDMTKEDEDRYLDRMRHQAYVLDEAADVLRTFLAAQKYRGTDIRLDLYNMIRTGMLSRTGHHTHTRVATDALFERYGESLTASEVESMRRAWEDAPEMHDYLVKRAQGKGFLLDFTPRKSSEH